TSSLAFRSHMKPAAVRAGLHKPVERIAGLTPQAAAFHAAAVAQDRPVILIVPTDGDVDQATSDARFFLSSLLGLSEQDSRDAVLSYPSQEVDPFRALSPHLAVASARARALYALTTRTARVVVASARALLPRLSATNRLQAAGLRIE